MEREINIYSDNNVIYEPCQGVSSSGGNKPPMRSKSFGSVFSRVGGGTDDKNYDLFAKQISHLLVCFDLYLETEASFLNDCEFKAVKLFPSSVRGRDRKRPYAYLESRNIFLQRMQYENDV
jgi:hypothetical protein